MPVLPRTQLGYTLGIRRDKDIYGQGEKAAKNPFAHHSPQRAMPAPCSTLLKTLIVVGYP